MSSFARRNFALILLGTLGWSSNVFAVYDTVPLKSLEYTDSKIVRVREEVKYNLQVSVSNLEQKNLVPLRFLVYKVEKKDTFFKIMARTGMDLDTLSSVNQLASPQDIYPGMELSIPNMRGVYDSSEPEPDEASRRRVASKFRISSKFLYYDDQRKSWFVPGRGLPKEEKNFFYGLAFSDPLADEGRVSSKFGRRKDPFTKKDTFHGGVDLAAEEGTPVYASADGTVSFADHKGGYGSLIVLKHILGYETKYGHLSKMLVAPGTKVKKGQLIGAVGMTGRATGFHLHFEVLRNSTRQRPVFQGHI
ncbi:M23 family metallopeptidase [Leptospira wolffii]|uniref:M23 family metallopeptidase n=1 Tax=Leptospira wolffii TaxID=409998 RepID=UPI0002EF46FB|nr:M23 family metallopeptidase [Leptospira wolffii]EPG65038.1 peptidase, M23 family [Leptospira wolffii serovar Khorat str. Khorat-H2]TGK61745.1 M23 family metallopeptidase [Leptospira wolffii]TGK70288.1 M23 family metallopeptidase [Leptospira wolffii]TGK77211.1 M23 family metallopeptidase [Leptospira wolffii]TGL30936.1 M23 family metallopeptidase [Leptospira wolffii]